MKRIDWLTHTEKEEMEERFEIKTGQLWQKFTDTPHKNLRVSVYVVRSIKDGRVTIKSVLNRFGRGTSVTKEFLESNYVLTTLEEVQKLPQYRWLDSNSLSQ